MNRGSDHESSAASAVGCQALVCLTYAVSFLALDYATEGIKGSLSVSLWFPPVGLTFALLLFFGWRWAAAVVPVFLLHLILFRDGLGWPPALLLAVPVLYAALYGGVAALLLRVARIDPRLLRMRDVAWFVGAACLLAPLLVAALVVSGFVLGGYAPAGDFWGDLLGFWAGDATGIAVLVPLLLIALRPVSSLRGRPTTARADRLGRPDAGRAAGFGWPSRRELPEVLAQLVVLVLSLVAAYGAARGASLDYAYLAFGPVAWVALRGGFERAVLAALLVNVGVVLLASAGDQGTDPTLLQFGLMALTLVALLLGAQKSEQGRAEAGIKESEGRYRALMESSVETMYLYDAETKRVLESNEAFREMIGYAEEELWGMEIYDFIAHDREDIDRRIGRSLEVGGRHIGERNYRRKDGSIVVVETSSSVVPYDGRTTVCAVSRDVTELKEARERLEESERRFRSLIRNAPDAITVLASDSTILYDSPAIERLLGHAPAERIGKKGFEYVHPDDVELARRTLAEVLENPGIRLPVEYRLRHKDGTWRHFEAARTNLLDDPAVGGIVLNYRDVSGRKEAEEALRLSEERQRRRAKELSLLHEVRSALAPELDPRGVCREVVEAVAKAYGYVLVSAYLLEAGGGDRELVMAHQVGYRTVLRRIPAGRGVMWRVARTGEPVLLEDAHSDPEFLDAIQGIVSEVCVPLFDGDEAVGILNVESTGGVSLEADDLRLVVEVGEHAGVALGRARLHERVAEAEERFRTAFENASAGVALVGLDRRYLRANRALCEMLGYAERDLLKKRSSEITHPGDLQRSQDRAERMLSGEAEATSLEKRYLRKDGGVLWAISDVSLVRDRQGRPSHFVSHFQDVTERREAEEALKGSEERYRAVVEQTSEAIWLFDPDTKRILESNAAFRELLGYTAEELAGMTNYDFVAHSRESVDRVVARKAGDERSVPEERKYRRKDGTLVDVEVDGTLISYRGEEAVCSVARDLTERKRAEEALRENESRLRAVTEGAPVVLFALDADGVLTLSEGKGMRSLGLRAGEGVGLSVFEAYRGLPVVLENVRRALAGEEVATQVEIGSRAFEARYSPTRNGSGEVSGVIGVATEVTERKELEEELERQALHDPLTGLPNRRLLIRCLSRALVSSASKVALLFLDLDDFKVVNDSLGHEAGDRLLALAAERLRGAVRPSDLVARLGGDEFVVLLEDADLEKAYRVARRISGGLLAPFAVGGREVRASASVGIALGGAGREAGLETGRKAGPGELLKEADVAMYRAKRSGKGSYAVFNPRADARALERLELENALRRGLERGEFSARYQPVVSVADGEVVGFEALLRWEHPERGLLPPAEFLAVAEETGLSVDLDGVALGGACRLLAALGQGEGAARPWVAVNVSPRRLREPGLARAVAGALRGAGADPARLVLEVTEDAVVEGDRAEAALGEVKVNGTKLALDDFGTGYSSLSYLERLPIDLLKLDRAFVGNLGSSRKTYAVVRAVVDLAHATGMAVVAEGIETEEQLGALRRVGCDHAQGYLFSGSLGAEEAASFVADRG